MLDDARFTWRFTVDLTPPTIDVPPVVEPVAIDAPAEVKGRVEAGSRVRADGDEVEVDDDGSFTLSYTQAPAGPIALEAVDEAGNVTPASVVVPVTYPSLRGVHVERAAWGNEQLRNGILRLVDEGRIDTVELDLKDDQGIVGYDTTVERARQIGAVTEFYDLDGAVRVLQDPRGSLRDRQGGGVPRSDAGAGRLGGGRDQPGDPVAGGRSLWLSRAVHQLRRSGGAPLQPRHRARRGGPRRRRHPVGRHPAPRRRSGRAW